MAARLLDSIEEMKIAMSRLSQTLDQHLTQSEASSTSLKNEIVARLAKSNKKIEFCNEEVRVATKRVDYIVELLEKEERNKTGALTKMIEIRQKKLEDKARKREEKKKTEDDKKRLKEEKRRKRDDIQDAKLQR